jgi:pimeloyl-ACP methyl ester carboxylesterase
MTLNQTWYKTSGSGSTKILFLHGWFWDHRVYSTVIDTLDDRRVTCAAVDIRGYGESRHVAGEFTVREMAADALAIADELGWDDFHVVGHSMGGKAAQRLAIDHPARVKSLVAVTPIPPIALMKNPASRAGFEAACVDDSAAAGLIAESVGRRLSPHWIAEMLGRTRETAAPEAFKSYMHSFLDDDFSAETHKLTARLLVVSGQYDGGLPDGMLRALYRPLYRHVTFETIANSGHYPMVETPLYFATTLERFIFNGAG